jgi:cytochrome c553
MTFVRVAIFSLAVVLIFTLFANILPQVRSDPPQEETVDIAALDVAGQVTWGRRLYEGKGTCTLCHNNLGRAPDLLALDLAAVFRERTADPRYTGEAAGLTGAAAVEPYLRESLVAPSAFVVAGYGKKGTNDSVSPMSRVDVAPTSLSEAEIDALIAFLQAEAGAEVTVPLPAEGAQAAAPKREEAERGPAATAEAAMARLECAVCHDLGGSAADLGPDLAGIAARLDRAALRRAILAPDAEVAEGFLPGLMPQDYAHRMWAGELEMVVDHLLALPAREQAE